MIERLRALLRGRGGPAQLHVLQDGRTLVDEAVGCAPDALFWAFSAGKPFVALIVHQLAERGDLALDDPVVRYWPGFGRNGKERVTVRQVLRHRSGMARARGTVGDALAMADWERSVRNIERAALRWPPGTVPAYQPIVYGFILGEVIRRVTGADLPEVLRAGLLDPLGLKDTHLGLSDRLWPRHVPVRVRGTTGPLTELVVNSRRTRAAVIPAAGLSTTARDLARFYAAMLDGGVRDGVRVVREDTLAEALRGADDGQVDRVLGLRVRWATGFQLGGAGPRPPRRTPMGMLSGSATFGHNGSNCCIGWADPRRRLAFACLTAVLPSRREGSQYVGAVSDTVLRAVPPT
ncbi:serine hydrolase domain-containing protein [Streptomyces sp. NPDC046939]|uniref:serine hydrolase domain-containing protein n=1 Tax=Streptomyces sp. NPDC046939 TaxID=3155376 RepID=UPI0033F1A533